MASQETVTEALSWAEETHDTLASLANRSLDINHPSLDAVYRGLIELLDVLENLGLDLDDELDELAEEEG